MRSLFRFVAIVVLTLGGGAVLSCSSSDSSSVSPIASENPTSTSDFPLDTLGNQDLPSTSEQNSPTTGLPTSQTTTAPTSTTSSTTAPTASPTTTSPPATTAPATADPTTTTQSPATASFPDAERLSVRPLYHFDSPAMALATHPNFPNLLYFALRDGRVVTLDTDFTEDSLKEILDIGDEVSTLSELGLSGLTFSPDGQWLLTMSHGPDLADRHNTEFVSQVYAWELSSDGQTDLSQRRLILEVAQPFGNHNGGDISFGPDGKLYIGLGDGGAANDPLGSGQNTQTLLGSILRIEPNLEPISQGNRTPNYTIPPDNPFADSTGGAPEIWLYGVRNPWRFSFDSATGDLWIADVGQNKVEEINRLEASKGGGRGANLGWNAYEGSLPFASEQPGLDIQDRTQPVFEYLHSEGRCASVTGGYVYRGSALSGYEGVYIFGDFCASTIFGLVPGVSNQAIANLPEDRVPISFGRDSNGELYVLTLLGWVYQLSQ